MMDVWLTPHSYVISSFVTGLQLEVKSLNKYFKGLILNDLNDWASISYLCFVLLTSPMCKLMKETLIKE